MAKPNIFGLTIYYYKKYKRLQNEQPAKQLFQVSLDVSCFLPFIYLFSYLIPTTLLECYKEKYIYNLKQKFGHYNSHLSNAAPPPLSPIHGSTNRKTKQKSLFSFSMWSCDHKAPTPLCDVQGRQRGIIRWSSNITQQSPLLQALSEEEVGVIVP